MNRVIVILLLALAFMLPQTAFSRNYVMCVGLSKYPKGVRSLRVSDNDARVIQNVFNKSGDSYVSLLTNTDATCEAVLRAMEKAYASATADDAVIFYFSGHGSKKGLACYDGVISYDKIIEVMKRCAAHNKVIIADACFSGKMRGKKSWEKALADEEVIFFLSSRGEEPSRETKYSNSLFTIYLERGLRGGADVNRDRTITAREIYDFCHTGVIKDSHNKQHPVMWGKFSGDMPIIVWKTNTKEYESTND